MPRRALIALCALLAGAAMTSIARAESDEDVRAQIADLRIDPAVLYPTSLPSRLAGAEVSLSLDGEVAAYWVPRSG